MHSWSKHSPRGHHVFSTRRLGCGRSTSSTSHVRWICSCSTAWQLQRPALVCTAFFKVQGRAAWLRRDPRALAAHHHPDFLLGSQWSNLLALDRHWRGFRALCERRLAAADAENLFFIVCVQSVSAPAAMHPGAALLSGSGNASRERMHEMPREMICGFTRKLLGGRVWYNIWRPWLCQSHTLNSDVIGLTVTRMPVCHLYHVCDRDFPLHYLAHVRTCFSRRRRGSHSVASVRHVDAPAKHQRKMTKILTWTWINGRRIACAVDFTA
jgi:hypothetical protein